MQTKSVFRAYLLLLPGLGAIVGLMGTVICMPFFQSFGYFNFSGKSAFSTHYWLSTLADPQFWNAFLYSFRVALLSALIAVSIALMLALWLRRPFRGSGTLSSLLKVPLFVHGLVAAFLYVNFISFHGFLNQGFTFLGLTSRPIRMQNDPYAIGIVILQVWKQMPFALLLLSGAVKGISDEIFNAARDLGASSVQRVRRIVLPLCLKSIQASLVLIFIGAVGDFSFQVVAGPTHVNSLAQLMYRTQTTRMDGWNFAATVAVALMLTALFGSLLLAAVSQKVVKWGQR
ncbi:MAG: hypothetical protein CENE_02072 [Candidatus Celerinatantimonas neptuna]|nr:MAG: hypothetical protein CENE_02072 [Candidatus Celerinatantimonas neptuna]